MGMVGLKTPSSDITTVESSISHELNPQSREIWASAARLVSSLFPLHLPPAWLEDVKKCNEYYLTESLHVLKSLRQSKRVISVMFQSVCLHAGLQQLNLPGSKEFPCSVCQTAACILVVVGGVGDGGRGRGGGERFTPSEDAAQCQHTPTLHMLADVAGWSRCWTM